MITTDWAGKWDKGRPLLRFHFLYLSTIAVYLQCQPTIADEPSVHFKRDFEAKLDPNTENRRDDF